METEYAAYKKHKAYERARKRLKEIEGFYWNLFSYCIIIPFLIYINYITNWDYKWFWFSAFGWGTGLIIHGSLIFVKNKYLGHNWEERKIREFVEQEKI